MEILKSFIVFEGIDGAGTTTQVKGLSQTLTDEGRKVWATCEPTDHLTGKLLRQFLSGTPPVDPGTMIYLFAADRNEHVEGKGGIREACLKGIQVISDRYLFSSLAYQSIESDFDLVARINSAFPLPEYLFFLDLPVDHADERLKARKSAKEIYENREFQLKVKDAYHRVLAHFASSGMKIILIDGTLSPEEIGKKVRSSLEL